MDQPLATSSAGNPSKTPTGADAAAASHSESRGWRGALAGVFGLAGTPQTDIPVTPTSNVEPPASAASSAAAPGKPGANGESLRQICELVRTPLGGLIGMTDLVSAGGLTPAQTQYMAVIRASVAEALSTLEDLTELASEDQRFVEPISRPFAGSQILDPLALEFAPHCQSRQLKLTCGNNLLAGARLEGDLTRVTNLTRRILRIAVRHNEHTAFELSISAAARVAAATPAPGSADNSDASTVSIQITLGDFQIGIPSERADRILRGTPRADDPWAQDGQTGLALRACRATVGTLGGTLAIASAGNGLSRVLISVPMKMFIGSPTATAAASSAAASQASAANAANKRTPASASGPTLIDVEALTARCVNNKAVAAAVLESLARMLPEKLAGLREALGSSDAEKARTIAHTIKGSAANAAVEAVRSKALQIELMAKAGDLDGVTGALTSLEKIVEGVLVEIPAARAGLTATAAKAAA